jgi:arsenite-transporting ATPase
MNSASSREESVLPPLDWDGWESRFMFFTGKGGVGKTTVASAKALRLAERGRRVLVVSTDPASNLDDVFGTEAGPTPTRVPGVPGLYLMNLDPEAAAAAYRDKVVGPYRGVLPEESVRSMEEQLSGACTVEIAAFDEFTGLLADPELVGRFDHIVFDTAPTGHTLRLLSLPSAWSGYIETNPDGASCLGPLAGLETQRERYAATVEALADAERTTVVLVSRPEESALREAARAGGELGEMGIRNQRLVLNGLFADSGTGDEVARALERRQRAALADMPKVLRAVPAAAVPLVAGELAGLEALRALTGGGESPLNIEAPERPAADLEGLEDLVRELAQAGCGAIMTMGKGGVGKTTVAAALAVALARLGHEVHLSTTDPAAHLTGALASERPENLTVGRIDPKAETERYAKEVIRAAGDLDDEGRALLEEDLRSPCTEEIAVFQAFSRTLSKARSGFVVLDTAPTGHTLLLLDATGAYHKEILRKTAGTPGRAVTPLMRLQDPEFTRVLVVTLPETTPVAEAAQLQTDLQRAGIEPFGWVVNGSLLASDTRHPLLSRRAALEVRHLDRVAGELAERAWLVPWQAEPPTGEARLLELAGLHLQESRTAGR